MRVAPKYYTKQHSQVINKSGRNLYTQVCFDKIPSNYIYIYINILLDIFVHMFNAFSNMSFMYVFQACNRLPNYSLNKQCIVAPSFRSKKYWPSGDDAIWPCHMALIPIWLCHMAYIYIYILHLFIIYISSIIFPNLFSHLNIFQDCLKKSDCYTF